MKKTGVTTHQKHSAATVRQYNPGRVSSFLARVMKFYERRSKKYEVQLELVITIPYTVMARSAQEASDIIRADWEDGEAAISTDDISCAFISTFRNGTKEKEVIL